MLDSQQVFGQFGQAFQNLVQMAQQRKAQTPQLPPDAQVVRETAMAETQRKSLKDKADIQLAQAKLQKDIQEHQSDNQTKIAIENARITHEAVATQGEQQTDLQKHAMSQDTALQQSVMKLPPPGPQLQ
jgi:hypothetical protein